MARPPVAGGRASSVNNRNPLRFLTFFFVFQGPRSVIFYFLFPKHSEIGRSRASVGSPTVVCPFLFEKCTNHGKKHPISIDYSVNCPDKIWKDFYLAVDGATAFSQV